ncbi:MAG: primosomal protein N' [Rikenellaceae bacterium]|nr:primosomal protein N' [Rikenellaceae bacterium]MCL2692016.1 primosomal protein N' [Rikenellaceae bacterium]
MLYADIILPIARDGFTFEVGEALHADITEGRGVSVQLGAEKRYMGIVWRLHNERPPYKKIKTIDEYVANAPALTAEQRRFWEWCAAYYMCTLGEVMRAALPEAMKPEGFSREEFLRDVYKPRTATYATLQSYDETTLNGWFDGLERRAKKQYEALAEIVAAGGDVPAVALKASPTVLKELSKKKMIALSKRESTADEPPPLPATLPALTQAQQAALAAIVSAPQQVVLLHGVTGSGKTEVYINLIAEQLQKGKNVLYLLPEIAMTTQLVDRIRHWFGERVITYHSRFSTRHRAEAYRRVNRSTGGEVILGTRSSLFLPVSNLGLVIVDEEHDASYKQVDPAPRYHARDAAVMLARLAGAKTVLGSATPSVESWANAAEGKYGLATLAERYGGVPMPEIIVSDTLRAVKRGERTVHFNKDLLDRLAAVLARGRQAMLFQNRRGFAPYVECTTCGAAAMCPHCNVTLVLHKADARLRCHYCGHSAPVVHVCKGCGAESMEARGFGTEKVEEELARLFPEAHLARLDRDTATSEARYRAIISAFERGETDVLIGTQMISKGFDFKGVALVGMLNADNLLSYPDFRASERAFQTITQMAGRAGRRGERGEVVIQTAQPQLPIIREAAAGDYAAMAVTQLAERAEFFYPPYCRLIEITLRHRNSELLWEAANRFAAAARTTFGRSLLGPQPPLVDRIKNVCILSFLLKVERTQSFSRAKDALSAAVATLRSEQRFRYVDFIFNVDPQ